MRTILGGLASGHTATHRFPSINVHGRTRPSSARVLCADPSLAEGANAHSRGRAEVKTAAPSRTPSSRSGAARPGLRIVRRQIGLAPIPTATWAPAVHASRTQDKERSPQQRVALELAARGVDAVVEADALLFAVPLCNYGVSQDFKTWVDLAIADLRLARGVEPMIAGKPAVLVTVRGCGHAPTRSPNARPGPRHAPRSRGLTLEDQPI
jgi:hypothetical protein